MHTLDLRSFLWFTTGVVLTIVSIATFGAWRADAAVVAGESTFVPVTPCRLFDTRPDEAVPGSNTTPIGPEQIRTQQVTGAVGFCDIPAGASAVAFNITILNPTANGVLTLFPADVATKPSASNLNWVAGQPPTPNKVDVKLSPTGAVKLGNGSGTVDVIGDIVGYYTSSTVAQLSADVATLQGLVGDLTTGQATNTAAVTTLQGLVGTLTTEQATHAGNITALDASATALLTDSNAIPSGTTVTGIEFISDSMSVTANYLQLVKLPGNAGKFLSPADVNFGAADPLSGDTNAACTGTSTVPTAPAGMVCIYTRNHSNINDIAGHSASLYGERYFAVTISMSNNVQASINYVWAYTAP